MLRDGESPHAIAERIAVATPDSPIAVYVHDGRRLEMQFSATPRLTSCFAATVRTARAIRAGRGNLIGVWSGRGEIDVARRTMLEARAGRPPERPNLPDPYRQKWLGPRPGG